MIVVAIDYQIALNAVAQRFKDDTTEKRSSQQIARDYLAKVVQSSVQLEEPSSANVSSFVDTNLFTDTVTLVTQTNNTNNSGSSNPNNTTEASSPSGQGSTNKSKPLTQTTVKQATPKTNVIKPIKDTDQEQAEFENLTTQYAFTNPRQLIRLRNAFQLFRHVYIAQENLEPTEHQLDDGSTAWVVEFKTVSQPILHMLFWVEYLHTLSARERKGLDIALGDQPEKWIAEKKPWPDKAILCANDVDYPIWFKRVEAFVLPAADAEYKAPEKATDAEDTIK